AVSVKVLRPPDLNPKPGVCKPPQQRQKDLGRELWVKSELVNCIVAPKTLANEGRRLIEGSLPIDAERLRQRNQGVQLVGGEPTQLRRRHRPPALERPRRNPGQLAEQSAQRRGLRYFLGLE